MRWGRFVWLSSVSSSCCNIRFLFDFHPSFLLCHSLAIESLSSINFRSNSFHPLGCQIYIVYIQFCHIYLNWYRHHLFCDIAPFRSCLKIPVLVQWSRECRWSNSAHIPEGPSASDTEGDDISVSVTKDSTPGVSTKQNGFYFWFGGGSNRAATVKRQQKYDRKDSANLRNYKPRSTSESDALDRARETSKSLIQLDCRHDDDLTSVERIPCTTVEWNQRSFKGPSISKYR